MDNFYEQIIPIRKTGKTVAAVMGIWVAVALLTYILFLLALSYSTFFTFIFLLIAAMFYGAYKLTTRFSIEYEYIITNGTFDIDRITAKSSRKRLLTFEIPNIDRIEKYNPNAKPVGNYVKQIIACNEDDPDAYFAVVNEEGKGSRLIVFAPDERIRQGLIKALPKFIANSAFKN